MASVNKVILIGNLGRDPEVRVMSDNRPVVNLAVATSRTYMNPMTNQKVEETEWHRVVLFSKLAEIAQQYLRKGSSVYIEGRIKTRKWEKDGQTHYSTDIIAESMQMLGGRSSASDSYGAPASAAPAPEPRPAAAPSKAQEPEWGMEEDVPF